MSQQPTPFRPTQAPGQATSCIPTDTPSPSPPQLHIRCSTAQTNVQGVSLETPGPTQPMPLLLPGMQLLLYPPTTVADHFMMLSNDTFSRISSLVPPDLTPGPPVCYTLHVSVPTLLCCTVYLFQVFPRLRVLGGWDSAGSFVVEPPTSGTEPSRV